MALNDDVKNLLQKYGQQHLLQFFDRNSLEQNKQLIDDINSVDFQSLCLMFNPIILKNSDHLIESIEQQLQPLDAKIQQDIRQTSPELIEKYRQLGE